MLACDPPGSANAPSAEPPEPPRLVLLYAPCTVNMHQLAPYDPAVQTTPHLAAFAEESVVFERHQTEAGFSGIAYASLFAGADASVHGIFAHPDVIEDRVELAAEVFAAAGYQTYFYDGHLMANRELGYAQGVPEENRFAQIPEAVRKSWRGILERLRENPDERAFVITAFSITHKPYHALARAAEFCRKFRDPVCPPPGSDLLAYNEFNQKVGWGKLSYEFPESARRAGYTPREIERYIAETTLLYRAALHQLDRLFGGLLSSIDAAGLRDQSIVVFTADHGEVLSRRGALFHWHHGSSLAPEVLTVPLLVRAPGLEPGRISALTRSIDVLPTLAGLADVPIGSGEGRGVDLSPVLRGEEEPPELAARAFTSYLRTRVHDAMEESYRAFYPDADLRWTWVSERRGDEVTKWRNLGDGEFALQRFDLARDPFEEIDLAGDPSDEALRTALEAYKASLIAGERAKLERTEGNALSTREIEERLRSLGYVP